MPTCAFVAPVRVCAVAIGMTAVAAREAHGFCHDGMPQHAQHAGGVLHMDISAGTGGPDAAAVLSAAPRMTAHAMQVCP